MADKDNFEYISDILDSMRAQNAINAGSTDKILTNISHKLEKLLGEENSDLMKVFMLEMKKTLDDRHHFVAVKFGEIESSFQEIIEKSKNQLQPSEIKELFEIIASNLNTFSNDFASQKEVVTQLDLKIEELKQDESQKKEILKNISTLKIELEKVNNGFESVILTLSTNFKEVARTLDTLDKSEELGDLKKDIDNISLSMNAVLSTMQVIDHKNRELEEIITHMVSKEDFELEREQVAKLIAQNVQLNEYVSTLPTQGTFEEMTEKFDTSIGVINALKNMLIETGKQNQHLLTAQLDSLETKILNISTEEEFIGFRKELAEFAQNVGESTNLMRVDIADTNANLKELIEHLNPTEIRTTFENFSINTKTSEENIKTRISDVSKHVSDEMEKNRKITKSDVDKSVAELSEKLDGAAKEITEGSKLNLASILEHIQGVVNNIFAVKNALHIENMENVEAVDAKFQELKEEIATSNNFIAKTSHTNLETITSNLDKVSQEIYDAKDDLGSKIEESSTNFTASYDEISKKIEEIKEELNQSSQESFANISSVVDDFAREAASVKAGIEQTTSIGFANLKTNIEELAQEFNYFTQNFDVKNQENLSSILSRFENVAKDFDNYKEFLSQSAQLNFETIANHVQEISQNISKANADLSEDLKSNLTEMQSAINVLPEAVKETQRVFGNENRALLEENSKNIVEMGDKIHSLIKSLMAKENPLKGELLGAFDELKSSFDLIKEDLTSSNQALGENVTEEIRTNIQNLEDVIADYSEKYDSAVISLQNRIEDKLELIDQTAQNNNFKLSDSIKETSEVKAEILSLAQSIDSLKEDSALVELSEEIGNKFEGLLLNIRQIEEVSLDKNKDALQEVLNSLENNFGAVSGDLKKYQNQTTAETSAFVEEISDKLETLKSQINLAGTDIINALSAREETVLELLVPIKETIEKIAAADFEETILGIKNKVDSSLSSISATIQENIEHENEELSQKFTQDFEVLNDKFEQIVSKSSLHTIEFGNIKDVLDEIVSEMKERFILLGEKLGNNEFLNGQFDSIRESISEIKEQNTEAFKEASESLLEKMIASENKLDAAKEEINGKITQLHEELENAVLNELQENISVIKEVLSTVSDNKDEETPLKIAEIEDSLTSASEKIDKILENVEKDQQAAAEKLLKKLKTSFHEKVDDSMDDLRSFLEVLGEKQDIPAKIDNLKEEIFDKFTQIGADFEQNIAEISVKKDLNELKTELDASINTLMEDLSGKISAVIEENASGEILSKTQEVAKRIEDLKNLVAEDITNKLAEFEVSLEKQSKDFAELLEVTKGSLAEVKESFVDLTLNSTMEISNVLVTVQEKIENIESKFGEFNLSEEFKGVESKIDALNFDEKFDSIETKISELNFDSKFDELKNTVENIDFNDAVERIERNFTKFDLNETSLEEIKQEFEIINQKLDLFAMDSGSEIKQDVEEIKQIVESQNELIKQFNKAGGDVGVVSSTSDELKKIVEKFEDKLNLLALEDVAGEDKSGAVKKELTSFKEELFENLVEFFNQISFVAEAEEIKDFVEDKTNEIKHYLKSIQTGKTIEEIKVAPQDEEYSYTLQDVESDIAKVRMVLNDIAKTGATAAPKAESAEDFEKLNENIMSISSRTNKLLLNSDESYAALRDNLENLRSIVYKFEEKIQTIDIRDTMNSMERKLKSIDKLVVSSVQSDRVFNQALMYLAEWIDKADERMANIEEKISDIEDIKISMLRSDDLEMFLEKFLRKFDRQQEKIKTLETKIEKLSKSKTKAAPEAEVDIKAVVQEVLSKIELSEKPDEKLVKKMDGIDRRLTSLGKNIEKITSYVE